MLVEIAIGDAYGAGFEYTRPDVVEEFNDLRRYIKHPLHHDLRPGQYTDDTQMSIALAEGLLDLPDWNTAQLAQKFCETFARDPRKGYSRGFQTVLEEVTKEPCKEPLAWGIAMLDRIGLHGGKSTKNGAAMRACPLGIIPDLHRGMGASMVQAMVTHSGSAIDAAVGVTAATHYIVYKQGAPADLPYWLEGRFKEPEMRDMIASPWPEDQPVLSKTTKHLGFDTFRAAVWAVARSKTLSEVLKRSIAYTGDVDTVGAIAMGIACEGLENDLPRYLYDALEDGTYGRRYLEQLDKKLEALRGK